MGIMEQAGAKRDWEHPKQRLDSLGKLRCSKNHLVSWVDVHNIVEILMHYSIDMLNDRVIDIADQTMVDALEACIVQQNKVFIKAALRSV